MNWFKQLFESIGNLFQGFNVVIEYLDDFVDMLQDTTNTVIGASGNMDFVVNKSLGAVRYIIGDTMYLAIYGFFLLGLGYTLYIFAKGVIKLINEAKAMALNSVFSGL